jgi:UDP-glucuronate decarboxylase
VANKKHLIAGGVGFLGANLAKRLISAGHCVEIIDNYQTGSSHNEILLQKLGAKIGNVDIRNFETTETYDTIWNFACPASPPKYQLDPIDTIDINYSGVKNLLEICQRTGARFVQSSTSEVYGDPETPLQNESYKGNVNTFGPRACYDEGKRIAETLCFEYQKLGVDIICVRIFNTYGPLMDIMDGRVVTNFISSFLNNNPLTIYGSGDQTRSFCYVDDLIEGIYQLHAQSCFNLGPINVGNSHEFTINELADLVDRLNNSKSLTRKYMPLPDDDPLQRRPDLSKIRKLTNWQPQIDLHDGVTKTIAYFRGL